MGPSLYSSCYYQQSQPSSRLQYFVDCRRQWRFKVCTKSIVPVSVNRLPIFRIDPPLLFHWHRRPTPWPDLISLDCYLLPGSAIGIPMALPFVSPRQFFLARWERYSWQKTARNHHRTNPRKQAPCVWCSPPPPFLDRPRRLLLLFPYAVQ